MNNKMIFAVNIIIILAVFTLNYFYQINDFDFSLKCICSCGFVLLGLVNFCYAFSLKRKDKNFYIKLTLGIVLAMFGDILINYNFVAGVFSFFLCHVFLVISYCFLYKINLLDFVLSGILFITSSMLLLFYPLLNFKVPVYRVICIFYASIICFMLGKSVGNFLKKENALTGVIAIASTLFFFSDVMLVYDRFIGTWNLASNICMNLYYLALCLLAFSIYLKAIETNK